MQDHYGLFEKVQMIDGNTAMRPVPQRPQDVSKMRSTLKSLVREWSAEGVVERQESFEPLL